MGFFDSIIAIWATYWLWIVLFVVVIAGGLYHFEVFKLADFFEESCVSWLTFLKKAA